jgi:hypothetical protein
MAKKQTFADKTQKKGADATKVVRLVFSYIAPDTGVWRFSEKLVKMGADDNEQQVLDNEIKLGRARLEKN